MIENKRTLLSIAAADLLVLAGSLFIMRDRVRLAAVRPEAPAGAASAPAVPAKAIEPPSPSDASKPEGGKTLRHILFTFRHSRPVRVEIVGSFNNWTPQPLKKGANHVWAFTASLAPGDYTYNYVVDGKVIRDPNNPRTAPEGRSLLTVKPLD